MIETDVRMTKDGVILIAHDRDFSRLCTKETIPRDENGRALDVREVEWN